MRSILTLSLLTLAACGNGPDPGARSGGGEPPPPAPSTAKATVRIDGSSTVFPITEAVAEEFRAENKARVTIGVSGTGGGFKKFCAGETDISGASRHIKDSEKELCAAAGVEYLELAVAYDGISVVVNPANDWAAHLTTDELKRIWEPEAQGTITNWNQVRADFPDKPLALFGPGVDSGTFDYFTKKIVGTEQASRGDFTASEDDNVLVHGVATDEGGLGFFGYAYYIENQDRLKVLPIQHGDGEPVTPTVETIADMSYAPLSRPIFIYVSKASSARPEVGAFIDFYLEHGGELALAVGYSGRPAAAAAEVTQAWAGFRVPVGG